MRLVSTRLGHGQPSYMTGWLDAVSLDDVRTVLRVRRNEAPTDEAASMEGNNQNVWRLVNMTQIPMDRGYTDILGIAVYSFAYYEGMVLSTFYKLDPKYFVTNRSKKLTSGTIAKDLITRLKRKKGDPVPTVEMKRKLMVCAENSRRSLKSAIS